MPDILLDTSFILPTLGVDVDEIGQKELELIREASRRSKVHCSYVSFIEILGLLGKKFRSVDTEAVDKGIRSLLESGAYRWVNPSYGALRLALELRGKGHKDNIDNLLFSMASESQMLFLSLDQELKEFLQKNGYDASLVVNVRELGARI